MLPSSVNFVIESFQDFTLYDNIKTPNRAFPSRQQMLIRTIVDDKNLKEELRSCQNFLVDSELERMRHKVFKYEVENLNETVINEKLDPFLESLKCSTKVNINFGFFFKNLEDEGFRYFNTYGNKTLLDRSKFVCNEDDRAKLNDILNKTDVIGSCSRERKNAKWRFYKLTPLTVFAALLKDEHMGCKDAVLPEPPLKNHTVNILTYEKK